MKKQRNQRKSKKAPSTVLSTPADASTGSGTQKRITPPKEEIPRGRAVRYNSEQQAEIVEFVINYDAEHGRAGKAAAVRKYGVSHLTISKWLKSATPATKVNTTPRTTEKPKGEAQGIEGTLKQMLEIQLRLEALQEEYDALRSGL